MPSKKLVKATKKGSFADPTPNDKKAPSGANKQGKLKSDTATKSSKSIKKSTAKID